MHVGVGTFFQNPGRARPDAEVWRQGLEIAAAAEPLGFDSVWSAEHHFTDYHMCPNVAQFLTWVAARTQRVQLGSMVMVLPWHDPTAPHRDPPRPVRLLPGQGLCLGHLAGDVAHPGRAARRHDDHRPEAVGDDRG